MKKKKILSFTLITSFVIFLISLGYIVDYSVNHIKTKRMESSVKTVSREVGSGKSSIFVNPPSDELDNYWLYINEDFLRVDFTDLVKQNKDTVAWINVRGTDIDNVVVQGTDNNYYLNHSFDGSKNRAGWIFSDYRNDFNNLKENTVIYGHNMKDNSMFGTLKNILKKDWQENTNNHIIKISSLKENTIWEVFSVYTIYQESYYITTDFNNLNNYEKFLETLKNRSVYNFNASVDINDKILTLSSCKDYKGNRIVLHAKLIKKESLTS